MKAAAAALGAIALLAAAAPAPSADLPADGSTKVLWTLRFASPQNDWINQVLPLKDGNFLALGFLGREDGNEKSNWRALAAKFTRDGRVLWQREYGAGSGRDAFWTGVEAADGRILVTGFTDRIGAGGLDSWIAVLDPKGELVAETTVGGSGYDRTTDIAASADGGFVAAGFTTVEGRGRDILLMKMDSRLHELWRRTIGGAGDDSALYLEPVKDGGFVVAGGTDEAGDGDVLILKVDAEGREVWRRTIGERGGVDVPHNLLIASDGRILASGYTASWASRGQDMLAITLSPTGELLRQEVFGGSGDDRVMVSGLDAKGRAWLTGYTKSGGAGGWDVFLTRLDKDGGFEGGVTNVGGPADDNGTAVLPLDDGTVLVSAYSKGLASDSGEDALVMRLSPPAWTAPPPDFRKRRIR